VNFGTMRPEQDQLWLIELIFILSRKTQIMSLTDSQTINLEAFKMALDVCKEQNVQVSDEVRAIAHDLTTSADQLRNLSTIDPTFESYYQSSLRLFQADDQPNKRSGKVFIVHRNPRTRNFSVSVEKSGNFAAPHHSPSSIQESVTWNVVKHPSHSEDNWPQENAVKPDVLKTLEKTRLSTCDLALTLDQPLDRTQQLVQTLWQDGLIDALTASPLFIIFPGLRSPAYRQQEVPTDTLLTLTSKGYFSLYPMFKSRESYA
jgi:hypothetical protein